MESTASPAAYVRCYLRDVEEGQVLLLADIRFTVLVAQDQPTTIRLDLAADDEEPATLIGLPQARVVLSGNTGGLRRTAEGVH